LSVNQGRDTFEGIFDNPITLNKYLYANANPVIYVDPSGKFSISIGQIGIAVFAIYAITAFVNAYFKETPGYEPKEKRFEIYLASTSAWLSRFRHNAVASVDTKLSNSLQNSHLWEFGPTDWWVIANALFLPYSPPGVIQYRSISYSQLQTNYSIKKEYELNTLEHGLWQGYL